ncbi:hypothetical protein L7F22_063842 [Adiantum nelumboides]|nr:hypothetical protein [Adiantum nelumboides]
MMEMDIATIEKGKHDKWDQLNAIRRRKALEMYHSTIESDEEPKVDDEDIIPINNLVEFGEFYALPRATMNTVKEEERSATNRRRTKIGDLPLWSIDDSTPPKIENIFHEIFGYFLTLVNNQGVSQIQAINHITYGFTGDLSNFLAAGMDLDLQEFVLVDINAKEFDKLMWDGKRVPNGNLDSDDAFGDFNDKVDGNASGSATNGDAFGSAIDGDAGSDTNVGDAGGVGDASKESDASDANSVGGDAFGNTGFGGFKEEDILELDLANLHEAKTPSLLIDDDEGILDPITYNNVLVLASLHELMVDSNLHGEAICQVDEEVRDIRVAFAKIKKSIESAQQTYKRAADKHRKPLQFKEGDWVLLRFTKARLNMTTGKNWKGEQTGHQKYYMKLAKRYYGPFQILSRINETAYRLKLPTNWHIHNAFHVSLLKPFKGDPPKDPVQEEPPLFDDIEEVLQPEEILRHEENTQRSGKVIRKYLVKFKHYSNEDSKWMQETQMKDVLPLLQAYITLHGLM